MRLNATATLLVLASLVLAGCIAQPEESTEGTADDATTTTRDRGGTGSDGADGGVTQVNQQEQENEQEVTTNQSQSVNQNQSVVVNLPPWPTTSQPPEMPRQPTQPAPQQPPAAPTPPQQPSGGSQEWPREGSTVVYEIYGWHGSPAQSPYSETRARAEWTYSNGDWTGRCVLQEWSRDEPGEELEQEQSTRTYQVSDPPHWPLFNSRQTPHRGGPIDAWYLQGCEISAQHASYNMTTQTTWNGQPLEAHTATEFANETAYRDLYTEWDDATGLVLRWTVAESGGATRGELVSTDANVGVDRRPS